MKILYSTLFLLCFITQNYFSQTQNSFVNHIDGDTVNSIREYPTNSIVMYGGVPEVAQGMILIPYNRNYEVSGDVESRIKYVGLITGEVIHDFVLDTSSNYSISFCKNRDDSTSFIIGSSTAYSSTGISNDTVVSNVIILNHNGLSIEFRQDFQFPNSKMTLIKDIIYNSDSSITAIGIYDNASGINNNFKIEISSDLSQHTFYPIGLANFSNSSNDLSPLKAVKLSNGSIVYTGKNICNPSQIGGPHNIGIAQISPYNSISWSKDFQSCGAYHSQSLEILALDDNTFYTLRELETSADNNPNDADFELLKFSFNKTITDSIVFKLSYSFNSILCPPVMDSDGNLIMLCMGVDTSSYSSLYNPFIVSRVFKMDLEGNVLWHKDADHFLDSNLIWSSSEILNSLNILPNDDIIISGPSYKQRIDSGQVVDINLYVQRITSDGCSENSCADYYLGVDEVSVSSFKCFPNPAKNSLTVEFEDEITREVSLIDMTGRILEKRTCSSNILQIDLSSYSNGIYFISVFDGEKIRTEKVILKK